MIDLSNARVLVTGGDGFLGRRVRAALASVGCKDVLAPSSSELDLLERDRVRAYLSAHRFDLVFHLAARVGGIGANRERPGELFMDNAQMGLTVVDECHRAKVGKLVAVATVCAYPKFTPAPFREDALWDGYPEETNAPYGLAKKMLLVQAQAYRAQYGFNGVVLLPANLYGPGDNFALASSHVVPAMIRKIDDATRTNAATVSLWGDGSPTRELLFVDDCARALVLAAERYDGAEPVNIGTGSDISIRDLANKIKALLDYHGSFSWNPAQPNGQPKRQLDVTRARERFGFTATVSLDDGLARTVEWWRSDGRADVAASEARV